MLLYLLCLILYLVGLMWLLTPTLLLYLVVWMRLLTQTRFLYLVVLKLFFLLHSLILIFQQNWH